VSADKLKKYVLPNLPENLKLELNADKTLITNLKDDRVRFLGYEISKSHDDTIVKKDSKGVKKRSVNETIQLLVPSEVINRHIRPFIENGKVASYKARVNLPVLDIINDYNSEIRGLYNYYSLATDVSVKLGKFKYYHYWSLMKTIAHKEKCSVSKVKKKYGMELTCSFSSSLSDTRKHPPSLHPTRPFPSGMRFSPMSPLLPPFLIAYCTIALSSTSRVRATASKNAKSI